MKRYPLRNLTAFSPGIFSSSTENSLWVLQGNLRAIYQIHTQHFPEKKKRSWSTSANYFKYFQESLAQVIPGGFLMEFSYKFLGVISGFFVSEDLLKHSWECFKRLDVGSLIKKRGNFWDIFWIFVNLIFQIYCEFLKNWCGVANCFF